MLIDKRNMTYEFSHSTFNIDMNSQSTWMLILDIKSWQWMAFTKATLGIDANNLKSKRQNFSYFTFFQGSHRKFSWSVQYEPDSGLGTNVVIHCIVTIAILLLEIFLDYVVQLHTIWLNTYQWIYYFSMTDGDTPYLSQ